MSDQFYTLSNENMEIQNELKLSFNILNSLIELAKVRCNRLSKIESKLCLSPLNCCLLGNFKLVDFPCFVNRYD